MAFAGLGVGLVLVLVASGAPAQAASQDVEGEVNSLAAELARAISNRDADAGARRVREDAHVVYVSDGKVIRGADYRATLRQFYSGLRELEFEWERSEIRVVGSKAGVFTGWARIHAVDAAGVVSDSHAVFTLLYANGDRGWELVTGHKTTVR